MPRRLPPPLAPLVPFFLFSSFFAPQQDKGETEELGEEGKQRGREEEKGEGEEGKQRGEEQKKKKRKPNM